MTTTECLLCLQFNKDLLNCIKINSTQWKEQCIESVIEKHLWPMATLKSNSSWLCLTCWTLLHEFDQFYRRVENSNLYYECLVKSEIEIEDATLMPENLIIPETVLCEYASYNSDTDETYESLDRLLQSEKTIEEDESCNTKSIRQINKNVNNRNPLEVATTEDSRKSEETKPNQILQSKTSAEEYKEQHIENVFKDPIYDSDDDSIAGSRNSDTAKTKSQYTYPAKLDREDYDDFLAEHYIFSCIICRKSCNSFNTLRRHFAEVHKREAYVICCGKKMRTRRCLVDHIHTHFTADKVFVDNENSIEPEEFNCDDAEDNISQTDKDHDDENPIELMEESSKTEIGKGVEAHQLENCAENYDTFIAKHFQIKCRICQHSSKTLAKLRQHYAANHKQEEPFVFCCGRKIKRPRCLFEHIHSHLNPDYFKCKYCPKVLKDRRNHLKHMLRHQGKLTGRKKPEGVPSTNMDICDDANYNNTLVQESQSGSDHSHGSLVIPDLKNVSESIQIKSESINFQDSTNDDNALLENCRNESDNSNSIKESQKHETSEIVDTYQPGTDPEEDQDNFLAKHIQLTCPICQQPCHNFTKLRHHFAVKHNKQPPYILCCGRKHKRRRCLVEHIKTHLNPDYFKCKYCAKVLKERRHFLHHIATHEGTAFRCGICDRKFGSKYEFESHKTSHSRKEFSCSECSKSYDKRYQLTRHERAIHRGKTCSPDKAPEEESEMVEETDKTGLNITSNVVKKEVVIEAYTNTKEDILKMQTDQNNDISNNCVQYGDDNFTEVESEKSNATESEDMEKYLPSHTIKPGEYDDFLAKHINITCSICQESYKNFTLLRLHFTDAHKRVGYVLCCGTKHRTRSFLVDHIHTHLNPEYFKCEECSKVFKERRGLITHIAWHKGKIYRCKICKRKFLDKSKYNSHKSTHASNKRQQFPCPECGKTFGNKALLSYHQKAMHLNMFVKLCDICGATFRGSECFKSHMEKHKGGVVHTFPCDICGRILSGKQTLKLHKMSIHPEGGILPYSCHICKKLEATRSRLNTHIRKAHATSYDHKCTICERAFKQSKSLRAHMVVHTGEPLFTCTWCSKTFNSSGNLSSHRQRVHPSEYKEWKRQDYLGDLPPKLKSKTNP